MAKLGKTDLDVFELCLGGNIWGWTVDEDGSFAVLDAYAAAGGNFLDSADGYSVWVPGHDGGESERMLGRWMKARGNRDSMVVATKGGLHPGHLGLSAANVKRSCEQSLARLGTDHIDLYYAHIDDPTTPLEETLGAYDALVREGKVRYIAASNYTAPRLSEALAVSDKEGFARYCALQFQYSLMDRAWYERDFAPLLEREDMPGLTYYSLARGFLTGKYRPGVTSVDSRRSGGTAEYHNARGYRVLDALDRIAKAHGTSVAAVALAWLASQPTVAAPVASARTPQQMLELLQFTELALSAEEMADLDAASA
jgi:aryl-alcohol dehydrogenase-like predicted oxidoreductase